MESAFALSITGFPSPSFGAFGSPLPEIPAQTFGLADIDSTRFLSSGSFAWDGSLLTGTWHIPLGPFPGSQFYITADSAQIRSFYPMAYVFNEHSGPVGKWSFTGTRNEPEDGNTLLYLGIGMIVLGSAGIKRLAWRNQ